MVMLPVMPVAAGSPEHFLGPLWTLPPLPSLWMEAERVWTVAETSCFEVLPTVLGMRSTLPLLLLVFFLFFPFFSCLFFPFPYPGLIISTAELHVFPATLVSRYTIFFPSFQWQHSGAAFPGSLKKIGFLNKKKKKNVNSVQRVWVMRSAAVCNTEVDEGFRNTFLFI